MPIRKFEQGDLQPLSEIVRATNVFRPEEIDVAVELMEIVVENPEDKEYFLYTFVDESQTVRGYYCVGPTPMTVSTYDLYWIAVDPTIQGKGIGHQLIGHCEALVKSMGGTLVMVETSSQPKYDATNVFYKRHQYAEAARVEDYYAPGDDLIVYSKYL
ncbi:MAG: GNAT family N-acetyltransferase [Bacteroidota bacterium]